jgi:hypothetical protein
MDEIKMPANATRTNTFCSCSLPTFDIHICVLKRNVLAQIVLMTAAKRIAAQCGWCRRHIGSEADDDDETDEAKRYE